jgi:hypothetical protein
MRVIQAAAISARQGLNPQISNAKIGVFIVLSAHLGVLVLAICERDDDERS